MLVRIGSIQVYYLSCRIARTAVEQVLIVQVKLNPKCTMNESPTCKPFESHLFLSVVLCYLELNAKGKG